MLDECSKILNDSYNGDNEDYKRIIRMMALTNKWLKASGEEKEPAYYAD